MLNTGSVAWPGIEVSVLLIWLLCILMLSFYFKLHRINSTNTTADLNQTMVTKAPDPQQHLHIQTQTETDNDNDLPTRPRVKGADKLETQSLSGPLSDQQAKEINKRRGEGEDEGGGHGPNHTLYLNHHPNGGGTYGPRYIMPHKSNNKQHSSRSHSGHGATQGHPEGGDGLLEDPREQQENLVLRRGFVPRTVPERVAQRKSSMAQLQQWVNQRRGMASQEDINR